MEHDAKQAPDLERLVARQLAAQLDDLAVGSRLVIDSSSDLAYSLEVFITKVLQLEHSEWERESIDGFFFSSAVKSDAQSAELAGTCILITDQTVTPFLLDLAATEEGDELRAFRIRLGERGIGPLGISGPPCNSPAAQNLLFALNERLQQIDWVYDVTGH